MLRYAALSSTYAVSAYCAVRFHGYVCTLTSSSTQLMINENTPTKIEKLNHSQQHKQKAKEISAPVLLIRTAARYVGVVGGYTVALAAVCVVHNAVDRRGLCASLTAGDGIPKAMISFKSLLNDLFSFVVSKPMEEFNLLRQDAGGIHFLLSPFLFRLTRFVSFTTGSHYSEHGTPRHIMTQVYGENLCILSGALAAGVLRLTRAGMTAAYYLTPSSIARQYSKASNGNLAHHKAGVDTKDDFEFKAKEKNSRANQYTVKNNVGKRSGTGGISLRRALHGTPQGGPAHNFSLNGCRFNDQNDQERGITSFLSSLRKNIEERLYLVYNAWCRRVGSCRSTDVSSDSTMKNLKGTSMRRRNNRRISAVSKILPILRRAVAACIWRGFSLTRYVISLTETLSMLLLITAAENYVFRYSFIFPALTTTIPDHHELSSSRTCISKLPRFSVRTSAVCYAAATTFTKYLLLHYRNEHMTKVSDRCSGYSESYKVIINCYSEHPLQRVLTVRQQQNFSRRLKQARSGMRCILEKRSRLFKNHRDSSSVSNQARGGGYRLSDDTSSIPLPLTPGRALTINRVESSDSVKENQRKRGEFSNGMVEILVFAGCRLVSGLYLGALYHRIASNSEQNTSLLEPVAGITIVHFVHRVFYSSVITGLPLLTAPLSLRWLDIGFNGGKMLIPHKLALPGLYLRVEQAVIAGSYFTGLFALFRRFINCH